MQILPNQSWTLPTQDNGPGAGIANIGNVFGDPMQNALQKQKQAQLAVEAVGRQQMGSLFAHPGTVDYNTAAAAIANNADPQKIGEVFRLTNALHGGVDDDLAARAGRGIGEAFGSTPLGMQREQAAKMAETQQAAQIAAAAQVRAAGLHSVQGLNPDGTIGWTNEGDIAAHQTPQGMQPLVGTDMVKAALAAHGLMPQAGGAPAPAAPVAAPAPPTHDWGPAHAGGSPSGPIVADPGWTPPLDPSAAVAPAPANPGPAMTPDQRQFIGLDSPTKLEIKQTSSDTMGNPTFSKFDPSTGEVTPIAPPGGAPATLSDALSPTGDAYLATLAPKDRPMIRGMARGDIMPPPATTRGGKPNPVLEAVMNYDPTFSAADVAARFKLKQEAASVKGSGFGAQVNAGQLALGHLGKLSDLVAGLDNSRIPAYNSAKQFVGGQLGGQVPANVFNAEIPQLASEITRLYAGSEGSEAARQRVIDSLKPNMSPAQLNSSLAGILGQIQEKVGNLQNTWSHAMAPDEPAFPIIRPEHQKIIDAVMARADGQNPGIAAPPAVPGTLPPAPPASDITLPGVTPARPATIAAPDGLPSVGGVEDGHVHTGGNNWQALPGQDGTHPGAKYMIAPPPAAAAALKASPERRDEFDRKFGAGAAEKVLGK